MFVFLLGGGFVVGVVVVVKVLKLDLCVIGILMDWGVVMYVFLKVGYLVEVFEYVLFVDLFGGGIGLENKFSFLFCCDYLDDMVLVIEEEIWDVM